MNKILMSYLTTFFINAARNLAINRSAAHEAAQLKMKLFYLKIIKACRLLFIAYLGIGFFFVFLFSGLILLHATFFLYAPFSAEAKMWVGFAFAFVYLVIAGKAFGCAFSEQKWLAIFQAQDIFPEPKDKPLAQQEKDDQDRG